MSALKYRPEIEGLRGVAVLPVILFHMEPAWLPGGFLGVDVFFVISGYLITSIILRELQQGTFSFRNFWARRIRRILPAMLFVTTCTLTFTCLFVFRPYQQQIAKQSIAATFSLANVYFWKAAQQYWGTAAEQSPFLHAWSLSVEEQFYIVYPAAVWLVFRFRRTWLPGCIAAAVLASVVVFFRGLQTDPTATFYLLPTRAWELGAGCLLALSPTNAASATAPSRFAGSVGLGLLVASYSLFDTPGPASALSVASTALVIAFGSSGLCHAILTRRPLICVGKYSYSLYLWHWPVLVLADHIGIRWSGPTDRILLLSIICLLSWLTFIIIEERTRRRKGVVPAVMLATGVVAGAAYLLASTSRYYDSSQFNQSVWMHSFYNVHPNGSGIGSDARTHGIEIPKPEHTTDQFRQGGIVALRDQSTPQVVLLGDSHALMWAHVVNTVCEKHNVSAAFYAMSGRDPFCRIPPDGAQRNVSILAKSVAQEVDEQMLRWISIWKPRKIFISCFWERINEAQTEPLLDWLFAQNIEVYLIEDPPHLDMFDGQNALQVALWRGLKYNGQRQYWPVSRNKPNQTVHNLIGLHNNVKLISVYQHFLHDNEGLLVDGRECLYVDDDHLTSHGAMHAFSLIEAAVNGEIKQP
jgi:peptidoglycan/LPS O-acetylase OafA/YrhL